jgi:SAM-dependent methyltransferase
MLALSESFVHTYFNRVYNPMYDLTVGRFTIYQKLQEKCIEQLELRPNAQVLCVGVGTGNEITHLLRARPDVQITGIDMSELALQKAAEKARRCGSRIETRRMDARHLQFPDQSFDNVLCIHLMDFVPEGEEATRELLRVLRRDGRFAITYPADLEGVGLGASFLREGVGENLRKRRFLTALGEVLAAATIAFVYLPLLFRAKQQVYTEERLRSLYDSLGAGDVHIESHRAYFDFLVTGSHKKLIEGQTVEQESRTSRGLVLLQPVG